MLIYIVDPYSQDNWHYQQCTLSPSLNLHIRLLTRYHPALLGSNSIGSALRDGREKDKARTEWKNEKSGHQTKGGRPTRGMQAKWRILTHGGAEKGRYWTTLKGFCQKWSFCWNQFPMEIGQEREEDHHVLNQPMPCNGWYQNNSLGFVQIKPAFENFYVSPAELLLLFHQNKGPSDRRDIVLFCFVYDYGLWSEDPSRDCLMAPNQSVSTSIGDEVFHYAHVCACHNSFIGNGSVESKTTVSVYSNPGPVAWLQQGEVAVPRTLKILALLRLPPPLLPAMPGFWGFWVQPPFPYHIVLWPVLKGMTMSLVGQLWLIARQRRSDHVYPALLYFAAFSGTPLSSYQSFSGAPSLPELLGHTPGSVGNPMPSVICPCWLSQPEKKRWPMREILLSEFHPSFWLSL